MTEKTTAPAKARTTGSEKENVKLLNKVRLNL
jgi:hypothetical protein